MRHLAVLRDKGTTADRRLLGADASEAGGDPRQVVSAREHRRSSGNLVVLHAQCK